MTSKAERARRKALVRAIEEKAWAEAEASMPISMQDLSGLCDWFDGMVEEQGCDGRSLRHTQIYIREHGLNGREKEIVDWIVANGGGCDCEVSNVCDRWESRLGMP
jgi:hypothetical protein